MTAMKGRWIRGDHSFQFAKHVIAEAPSGQRVNPFLAVYCVMDEIGKILAYQFCKTKSPAELEPLFQGLKRRHELQVCNAKISLC